MIVTTTAGEAFSGVLHQVDPTVWILRDAEALGAGENGTPIGVDGELIVLVEDVAYAQLP